ncbi:hypothetical protein SAMN03159382_00464 [Pseudomonas sp. NFACC23-1]|nr:hypothetical protein SAMN03159386_00756 [Pseudomonas sp. NFACC17-2]SEI90920.1 hypothetical protein SAMN03159382_00464 [Pseudomonas sp. NFACC23-1]SFW17930.1 hypothetical protein SAMN05660640_00263 [Pseudomonas sp. NFACC16-2]
MALQDISYIPTDITYGTPTLLDEECSKPQSSYKLPHYLAANTIQLKLRDWIIYKSVEVYS